MDLEDVIRDGSSLPGAFRRIQDFLLELRDQYGFSLEVDKLKYALACAGNITDLEEVFYRLQSIVCSKEEEVETFRSLFAQRLLRYAVPPPPPGTGTAASPRTAASSAAAEKDPEEELKRLQELVQKRQTAYSAAQEKRKQAESSIQRAQKEIEACRAAQMPSQDEVQQAKDSNVPNLASGAVQKLLEEVKQHLQELESAAQADRQNLNPQKIESRIHGALQSHEYKKQLEALCGELMQKAMKLHGKKSFSVLLKLMDCISRLAQEAGKTLAKGAKKNLQQVKAQARNAQKDLDELESRLADLKKAETAARKEEQRTEWALADSRGKAEQAELEVQRRKEKEKREKEEQEKKEREKEARETKKENEKDGHAPQQGLLLKESGRSHRPIFEGGFRAVQTTKQVEALLQANLNSLSAADQQRVLTFIRTNARVFRQTLRRKHATHEKKRVDIRGTVKAAGKTNGEPLVVKYKKPHKSHAKVIIAADISGSCKHTATLALYFAAMMGEAFPGGCTKFAFVCDLRPVDPYFREVSPEEGVKAVYAHVPTRGVYSNYGKAIHQLRTEYGGNVHRDTTIIILGDARNNRNLSQAEDLKYLADRCKNLFWLNPEPKAEWDTGDSVMGQYIAAGARASCVSNVGELLEFLMQAAG